MSSSVDPDETAHDEPSHLDLRCLQKPILLPVAAKEFIIPTQHPCNNSTQSGWLRITLKRLLFDKSSEQYS